MAGQLAQNSQDLTSARDRSKELEAQLSTAQERTALAQKEIDARDVRIVQAETTVSDLSVQIDALKQELARIASALDLSEAANKEQQVQLADLGRRLNQALATKVEELARYRSEFFGKLRQVLGDRSDIRVVGDRFVFQSEVLFDPGSAALGPAATQSLQPVAQALKQIMPNIPEATSRGSWRVDGHTDREPIATPQFLQLGALDRARFVGGALSRDPRWDYRPDRLAAAGFGAYQPVDQADNADAYRKNRRIELKLTER